MSELTAQVLLHPDEVQMWLKHLKVCQRTERKEQGKQPKRGERRAEKELF